MKLLVIGATGGTGKAIVKQAMELGHIVTAFARNPAKVSVGNANLRVVKGNVLDYESVQNAVRGQDAVLCALGHKRWFIKTSILSRGTNNVIKAMEKHSVKRLVCETTLGISDSRGRMGLYYSLFVIPVIVFFYFRDKVLQERLIKQSNLDWIIVRPGQLTHGRKRGTYKHGSRIGNWIITVRISREDVADFMLRQLTDDTYLHKTPGVAY